MLLNAYILINGKLTQRKISEVASNVATGNIANALTQTGLPMLRAQLGADKTSPVMVVVK